MALLVLVCFGSREGEVIMRNLEVRNSLICGAGGVWWNMELGGRGIEEGRDGR